MVETNVQKLLTPSRYILWHIIKIPMRIPIFQFTKGQRESRALTTVKKQIKLQRCCSLTCQTVCWSCALCLLMQEIETFFPGKGVPLNLSFQLSFRFVIVSDLTGWENADLQYELCNIPRSRLMWFECCSVGSTLILSVGYSSNYVRWLLRFTFRLALRKRHATPLFE